MEPRRQRATGDLTALLRTWNAGDDAAFDQLVPLAYDELHRIALRCLAGERSGVSMQATALVNEVCLRLLGWEGVRWQNRGHFYGVSAQMMRRVLVDIARRRRAERRGGPGAVRVSLDDIDLAAAEPTQGWSRSTRRSTGWRQTTPARHASSNSVSSAGSRWRKRRRRWASRCAPRTTTGRSRAPGGIASWPAQAAGHERRPVAHTGSPVHRGAATAGRGERAARLARDCGTDEQLQQYRRFLELWKHADTNLPELAEARRALAGK